MPIDINVFVGAIDGFIKTHRHCSERGYKEPEINRHNWVLSRDTGTSSKTIYSVMTGAGSDNYDTPHDPDDFGRCHRLLKLFPEWVARLGEIAARFPEWKPLVENWAELDALYLKESPTGRAPRLYERMCELREKNRAQL